MKRSIHILLVALLLTSCYKDEIDISTLNTNPFDQDYAGPAVFGLVDTYVQTLVIDTVTTTVQVIEFQVNEDLFLTPASYSVQVTDPELEDQILLEPDPPLSNKFKYNRRTEPAYDEEICIELRLSNNQSTARMEVICATL